MYNIFLFIQTLNPRFFTIYLNMTPARQENEILVSQYFIGKQFLWRKTRLKNVRSLLPLKNFGTSKNCIGFL